MISPAVIERSIKRALGSGNQGQLSAFLGTISWSRTMRDAVLEGVRPEEIEALVAIDRGRRPGLMVALRLRAKGWIDMIDGTYLITVTGRALLGA
jgi:hypothetical protein